MSSSREKHPWFAKLKAEMIAQGGAFNAHLHLDRADTLDDHYLNHVRLQPLENSFISLMKKHSLINDLHSGPAFDKPDLVERVNRQIDLMLQCDTVRADTMVDVTADRVQMTALETLAEIKEKRKGEIDLRLASYSPLGFRDDEPVRWDIFEKGARVADFIGALPEADDQDDYPENIGFMESCRRVLELAKDVNKMVHFHTDQRNLESEEGTERVAEAVNLYGAPTSEDGTPMIWAIHAISPSTYDEERFNRLTEKLVALNIGIVCCPSAAIGMRQIRRKMSPTYNSIPRVLELLKAGVHVRIGSDNIGDICSPSTTADIMDEMFTLSAALRFYHTGILAKLAAGKKMSDTDRDFIAQHLEENEAASNKAYEKYC